MLNRRALFASLNGEWETPPALFEALDKVFHFNLDVCASKDNHKVRDHYMTKEDDALRAGLNWANYFGPRVNTLMAFENPPYGREIGKWVAKAREPWRDGASVVCLLPSRTETAWYQNFCLDAPVILNLRNRVKFLLPCLVCGAKTHWMYPPRSVRIPDDLAGLDLESGRGVPLCDSHKPAGVVKRWCSAPFPSCIVFFVQRSLLGAEFNHLVTHGNLGRFVTEYRW